MNVVAKITLMACLLTASLAHADDRHLALDSKFYASVGGFFADRAFRASAEGSVTPGSPSPFVDFESDVKVDDSPQLFVAEIHWQYSENWNLGLQYFRASRNEQGTLETTIEWEGVTYEFGADVRAETAVDITRIVFSRNFWQKNGHDFRLAAGLHWIDVSAGISGEATLDDGSTAFAASTASASLPIPNVGGVYRYSPSDKWLFNFRVDWFSADVGDYSGGIWNTMTSVNYRVAEHVGIGLGYQFFQIDGTLNEERWKGDLKIRLSGPFLQVAGFW